MNDAFRAPVSSLLRHLSRETFRLNITKGGFIRMRSGFSKFDAGKFGFLVIVLKYEQWIGLLCHFCLISISRPAFMRTMSYRGRRPRIRCAPSRGCRCPLFPRAASKSKPDKRAVVLVSIKPGTTRPETSLSESFDRNATLILTVNICPGNDSGLTTVSGKSRPEEPSKLCRVLFGFIMHDTLN